MLNVELNLKAELAILESKLPEAWPNKETLRPYLEKLLANPGSIVFLALEAPRGPEGVRIGKGWFSSAERYALRQALEKVNARRAKKGERLTSEPPESAGGAKNLDNTGAGAMKTEQP